VYKRQETGDFVRGKILETPIAGIILGSGLGELAESVQDPTLIPYPDIPNWTVSTVAGHQGRLVIGELANQTVLILQGRTHYYEGYDASLLGLPVRVMQYLEIDTLIVTNAAGGVNPLFEPGDPMLISDHINFIGMAGHSPLRGPNLDQFGPRFPDMSQPYDKKLMSIAREVAKESDIHLNEGVYAGLAGPSFETPAELRFLRALGADAVGMSTVPEVTVARHGNMRVLGISGISNKANLDGGTITTHEEVLEAGKVLAPKIEKIIRGVLCKL
jgi:purine-nucleoside phosphorylase